jgi:hypothetical protein
MKICVRLVPMPTETAYAPLGALGYCLMRTQFLGALWETLTLPMKTVDHRPQDKLVDVLVSLLSGCRAIAQVNSRLRPDLALAHAWGRQQFADQATITRTLDAFEGVQIDQLRAGSEALLRRESLSLQHNLAADWLWLDIDLTPLPISKHAEGSSKGLFGEKTDTVANWRECMRRSITRHCFHGSTQAGRKAALVTCRRSTNWRPSWLSPRPSASGRSCAPMRASAAMPTSMPCWPMTGRC